MSNSTAVLWTGDGRKERMMPLLSVTMKPFDNSDSELEVRIRSFNELIFITRDSKGEKVAGVFLSDFLQQIAYLVQESATLQKTTQRKNLRIIEKISDTAFVCDKCGMPHPPGGNSLCEDYNICFGRTNVH